MAYEYLNVIHSNCLHLIYTNRLTAKCWIYFGCVLSPHHHFHFHFHKNAEQEETAGDSAAVTAAPAELSVADAEVGQVSFYLGIPVKFLYCSCKKLNNMDLYNWDPVL